MRNKPFFSVAMPTYNRAHLLPSAIKSVLQQSFADFELVISNGGSTDNTREVVAEFKDERIKYVESKERLAIGDNYQNALDNTNGEYITFLSDDDVFSPIMFERVKSIIDKRQAQMIGFHVSHYYQDDDFEYNQLVPANSLEIPEFTGEITEFSSSQALKLLFSKYGLRGDEPNPKFIVPYLANAVYHNKVFARIKEKKKKMFATTPADMYLAAAVFYVIDSYICLDEPLHVWSRWAGNATGLASRHGDKLREHYEKLLNGQKLQFTPLKFALPDNCCVNAILEAKHDFENSDNTINIDWFSYFVKTYNNLLFLKDLNINVKKEFREFNEVLSSQPVNLSSKVKSVVHQPSLRLKRFIRSNLPFLTKFLKRTVQKEQSAQFTSNIVNGNEAGFRNVLESAQYLQNVLLQKSR